MQIQSSSYCIVASTLPIGFIATQIHRLRIERIYVLSKAHQISYQNLNKQYPAIEIVRMPAGSLMQSICFLFILLKVRLTKRRIVFFHECCLPIFDLLLCLVRPLGYYFPQVTMSGHDEIEPAAFPRKKIFGLLQLLRVVDRFKFYRFGPVGGNAGGYVVSIRGYPKTIICHDVGYSRKTVSGYNSSGNAKTNAILFVTGKSFVADAEQVVILSKLLSRAMARGYVCEIKDHPNPNFRLNFSVEGAVVIDPHQPVELLDHSYRLAVGVSSTALLNFNERAVSLLYLLENMLQQDRLLCVKHFDGIFPGNKINYVRSLDEFEELL